MYEKVIGKIKIKIYSIISLLYILQLKTLY